MQQFAGLTASWVFFMASAVHFYWALFERPSNGISSVVPSVGKRALFKPSRTLTMLVAIALTCCALLFLGKLGFLRLPIAESTYTIGLILLATALFLRSVGDFHTIGAFKKVKHTPFARMDSRFYVPLCIFLAICCILVTI